MLTNYQWRIYYTTRDCIKMTSIIPMPNKSKVTWFDNYKPVVLTSIVVMKCFEFGNVISTPEKSWQNKRTGFMLIPMQLDHLYQCKLILESEVQNTTGTRERISISINWQHFLLDAHQQRGISRGVCSVPCSAPSIPMIGQPDITTVLSLNSLTIPQ